MNKALSLHIGLNKVDTEYYGSELLLSGCHNDAQDMATICKEIGYDSEVLLDAEANSLAILKIMQQAADKLVKDDIFVITYAGHGAQIPDLNGDEPDDKDETWVLFDRMLIDDEIYQALSHFSSGVRIFFISDSCHSGSITRARDYLKLIESDPIKDYYEEKSGAFRTPDDQEFGKKTLNKKTEQYTSISRSIPQNIRNLISASVIQLSACQDNQLSADGSGNGLFTSKLKEVWQNGSFKGSYLTFFKSISEKMPPSQSPKYMAYGKRPDAFEREKPFTINSTKPSDAFNITQTYKNKTMKNETMSTKTNEASVYAAGEGNWSEVKKQLEKQFPGLYFPEFADDLEKTNFPLRNPQLMNSRGYSLSNPEDYFNGIGTNQFRAQSGRPICRAFFWGFHIEVSSQGLNDFINVANPINAIVAAIGPVTGPAAPFISIAATFIAGALQLLKSLDRGKGVYISMSWFAIGIFIPTTVPVRGIQTITRGPGEAYEQAGDVWYNFYSGGLFGLKMDQDILWNLPDGTVRDQVIVNLNPPGFGNVHFVKWLSNDPTVGHFRLHVGVAAFQGGNVNIRMMIRDIAGRQVVPSKVSGPVPITLKEEAVLQDQ